MALFWAILLATAGLMLVVYFSEQLVKGVVGTSLNFRITPFLISVVFLGFDPENLGVGAVGSWKSAFGIASGSIIGAAMVAMALALGITALIVPLHFKKISIKILLVPFLAVLIFTLLSVDQSLSRIDGFILLIAYAAAILFLIRLNKKGISIRAGGEVKEMTDKDSIPGKWKSAGLMLFSLAAIIGGSEMLVSGSKTILSKMQLSETVYGMTIVAFLVSIEEVARELPAALKGKPDISMGNVVGSILAFFLFNAGMIAMVRPVLLDTQTTAFYLPLSIATIAFILTLLLFAGKIPRWAGACLVLLYLIFVLYGFLS